MSAYIQGITSICHQDTFNNVSVWDNLQEIGEDSQIVAPDYKAYIPAASLRRFSPVLRMAITAALETQKKVGREFDSISVGTSLGCLKDTERFLQTFIHATGDTLSPTAFIQSTHNTIAGAISMALGNHAYNMTHTQNSLSFEVALIDALLCLGDGKENVLVGAADEAIEFLDLLRGSVIKNSLPFTSGVTFFALQQQGGTKQILDCQIYFNCDNISTAVNSFLAENKVILDDIALILYAGNCPVEHSNKVDYQVYTGLYYSSSSFAVHLANDYKADKSILIFNHQVEGQLGLTLIR